MKWFLVKADPENDYSIQDLQRDTETIWDGVHNFQAIASIKAMRPEDKVLIYHSQSDKAIVGEAVVAEAPFENAADPRPSWAVKLRFSKIYDVPVSLAEMKAEPSLKDFLLIRNGRLSVMEVPEYVLEWLQPRLGI